MKKRALMAFPKLTATDEMKQITFICVVSCRLEF